MTTLGTARTELAAVRDRIGETAYLAIAAGLDTADELRSSPGRDATAAARARGGTEFRRQPHLATDESRAAGSSSS